MNKQLLVHLRVYRGKTLTYNEKGQSTNENHIVSLAHDTAEWKKYLAHLLANGVIKAEVEKVFDLTKVNEGKTKSDADYYQYVEDFKFISEEVKVAMSPTSGAPLTAEQKQIKELTERLDALSVNNIEVDETKTEVSEELQKARAQYFEVFGKKGGLKWTEEEIYQKIKEEQTK